MQLSESSCPLFYKPIPIHSRGERELMRLIRPRILITIGVIAALNAVPRSGHLSAVQSGRATGGTNHQDDPCNQLPDPPGKALGIDKKCAPGGSSSGVV